MNDKLNPIETNIVKTLNEFAIEFLNQQTDRTGTYVTKSIKERIVNLGKEKFKICVGGFKEEHENEWLYDIVWYEEDNENNLSSVELVLECEQSYGLQHIKYDFEKLLLANAKMRIMICLAGNKEETTIVKLKEYFNKAVRAYGLLKSGDRILIIIWDDWTGDGKFIPHLIIK